MEFAGYYPQEMGQNTSLSALLSGLLGRVKIAFTQRVGQQLCRGMNIQLAHKIGPVLVDGLETDAEFLGNLPVRISHGDQAQNLFLPAGQGKGWRIIQQFQNRWGNDFGAMHDQGQGIGQQFRTFVFHEQAIDPGSDQLTQKSARGHACENNDLGFRRPATDLVIDTDALSIRHGNIQHQQVGPVSAHFGYRLQTVTRLIKNVENAQLLQDFPDSAAQNCMVVRDQRREGFGFRALRRHFLIHLTGLGQFWLRRISDASGFALLALLLIFSTGASATEFSPIQLKAHDFYADLTPSTTFLIDKDHQLTVEQVQSAEWDRKFRPIETNLIDFGFNHSKIWLKVPIKNATDQDYSWLLTHDSPMPDPLNVYLLELSDLGDPVTTPISSVTVRDPFSNRAVKHRHRVSKVTLSGGQNATLLIEYASKQATQLPLYIESQDRFYERIRIEDIHILGMLMMLLGMAFISTIYLSALGLKSAYFYGAYIVSGVLWLFHAESYSFHYFWPNSPDWNTTASPALGYTTLALGAMFAWSFTNARRYHPFFNVALPSAAAAIALVALTSQWMFDQTWFINASLVAATSTALLPILAGIFAIRRGQPGARLFTAGSIAVLSAVFVTTVGYFTPGMFNQDIVGHIGRYAFMFEGIVFALAIFVHTQIVRVERSKAMRKEIELGSEKLALSEALRHAQFDYQNAVSLADRQHRKLIWTAHDIRQPLSSLRLAMLKLKKFDRETADHLDRSFDYLDEIIAQSLQPPGQGNADNGRPKIKSDQNNSADPSRGNAPLPIMALSEHQSDHHEPGDGIETFEANIVLRNAVAMFAEEAETRGVELRFVSCCHAVKARPLELMRIVTNLISNAIKHAPSARVLVGCRCRGDSIKFEIHDTGPGMDDRELKNLLQPRQKGSRSKGSGMGLSIVENLAANNEFCFNAHSFPGRGTIFKLSVPRAAAFDIVEPIVTTARG